MATSDTSDAVLLLTAHLSRSEDSEAKPLTTEESVLTAQAVSLSLPSCRFGVG